MWIFHARHSAKALISINGWLLKAHHYNDPIRLRRMAMAEEFKVRAGDRRSADRAASIRIGGKSHAAIVLSNVSVTGVGLATSAFLPIGANAMLSFGDRDLPLRIQWQLGGHAGARFAEHASPRAIDALIASFGADEDEAA